MSNNFVAGKRYLTKKKGVANISFSNEILSYGHVFHGDDITVVVWDSDGVARGNHNEFDLYKEIQGIQNARDAECVLHNLTEIVIDQLDEDQRIWALEYKQLLINYFGRLQMKAQ